jgi:hypothetical protein
MSRCNAMVGWDYIEPECEEVVTRPEAFVLTVTRGAGRKIELLDREAAGRVLRGYMRQGLWPLPHGDHRYTIAVPAGRWHSAYLVEVRPA